MPSLQRSLALTAGTGLAALGYGTLIERNAFTVRQFDVPVLAPGADPIRVLHVSDLHILARQTRKIDWIRRLARLAPDLVINTGDTFCSADSIPAVMRALEPLFEFPGAFVPGNNDYFAPVPKNPVRYFQQNTERIHGIALPWPLMATAMADGGLAGPHPPARVGQGRRRPGRAGRH